MATPRKRTSISTKKAGLPNMSQLASIGLGGKGSSLSYDSSIKELRGGRANKVYQEMADHSAVIGACLLAIEMLIRKVDWKVVPGDDSAEEKKRAEIMQSMIDDMSASWQDTITEILSMIVYGWAWLEIVYKIRKGPEQTDRRYRSRYNDGVVGWGKWVLVPQETLKDFDYDEEGGIQGLIQTAPGEYKDRLIPIDKSLHFRTKAARNSPLGRSLLLNAYYPWQFVKSTMTFEGIGLERDLAGLPAAFIPPEYLDPEANSDEAAMLEAIKNLVTGVRQNSEAGIIFPMAFDDENNPLFEFKLLATGGMKQFDTNKIIERYERRMAMSLLSDFILMGHERVGSLALSRDKTTLIGRALSGILGSIAAVINRHAVVELYKLNDWNLENPGQFVPGDLENADIKTLGAYVHQLMSVGALTPDPSLEASLRDSAALPKADPAFQLGPGEVMPGVKAPDPNDPDPNSQLAAETSAEQADADRKAQASKPAPAKKGYPGDSFAEIVAAAQARRNKNRARKQRRLRAA